jgi:hypothetical protein
MKRLNALACPALCLALCSPLPGQQHVTLEPTLGIAQQEYRQAQAAWLREDPNSITADLLTANPADMHRRIAKIRSLRDDMMDKKLVYLDLIVKRYGDLRTRLTAADHSELPIPELRKGLQDEQSRLLAEQDRLESLIRDLPQGDEYTFVMRDLNAERTELVNLQNGIAMRIRSLDQIDQAQQAGRDLESKDPIEKKLEAVANIWAEERDKTKIQHAHWDAYYDLMDQEVDRGKATPKDRAPADRGKPESNKPKGGPSPQAVNGIPGRFSGNWVYESRPGAWVGFGEPVRASLELTDSGTEIRGNYYARVPGRTDMRDLILKLTGEEVSPGTVKATWFSQSPPGNGEMVLRLGGDRRVLVERTTASDTYFPRGMEVLLPR